MPKTPRQADSPTTIDLHEDERSLKAMADTMPQMIWFSDATGQPYFYNSRWHEFTGVMPEFAENGGWQELLHPEDREPLAKAWRKSLRTGTPYEQECRLYHSASGSYRWIIVSATPLRDDSGTILRWYGTCTDIDEQKRTTQIQSFLSEASKKLSATLNYQRTLANITSLCVPSLADWCTVDMFNEETNSWKLVALSHKDPAKVRWALELRENNPIDNDAPSGPPHVLRTGKAEFIPMITDAMLVAAAKNKKELELLRSIGFHSVITVPIRTNDKPIGVISFISSESGRYYTQADFAMAEELAARVSLTITNAELYRASQNEIRARRQLEKELRRATDQLEKRVRQRTKELERTNAGLVREVEKRRRAEEALSIYSDNLARSNRELQDFAYVASHDLQEPLRKIQAFGNLLEEEYGDVLGEGADYLQRMRGAAARMSTLIEDLLRFSRVTTKAKPFAPVDLNVIAEGVISDLETRIADTQGNVTVKQLPTVMADDTQMRQLLQNLISNALKFHRPGVPPRVTISARAATGAASYHRITVKDNGIGFNEKYLERIFAVFQRLHGRDVYEGTGIGLAVCRKIVERHGGTITAKSEKNKGSTFIITLPVNPEETQ